MVVPETNPILKVPPVGTPAQPIVCTAFVPAPSSETTNTWSLAVTPAPPRPPTSRAPALYIKPGTNEIISVSSRGAQYVTDTGESITAKELSTYTPYERKIKQYRYEKLNEKKEKIASQFVSIETIPTSEGFRYVAKTAIPTEDIIAGQDITKEWVDLSSRLKSRMEDPWDIMYKQPMGVDDTDSDDDLDRQTKEAFK